MAQRLFVRPNRLRVVELVDRPSPESKGSDVTELAGELAEESERIASQLGYFRPFPGYAHYRAPIKGLYMTGPHCHPGGGISGMGTITARVMLDDMGIKPAEFW